MKQIVAALAVVGCVLSMGVVNAQTQRTLGWDASPEETERVLEYHVFRDQVYVGAITVPARTFPFTINPGESATFIVHSYGWKKDENGNLLGEAGVGPASVPFTWSEPLPPPPPPPPVTSPDGATCQVGAACQLVDAGLHVWTLSPTSWAILKDGVHHNGGYSDWLLWYSQNIYAYRSDFNAWWIDSGTSWNAFPYDPRNPPLPPAKKQCTWTNGDIYFEGDVSPQYTIQIRNWSRWFAEMQLKGWTGNTQNTSKNRKNYIGTLYCVGL